MNAPMKKAEDLIQKLHYDSALAYIQKHQMDFSPYVYSMYLSRVCRGLYQYQQAISHSASACHQAQNRSQTEAARTELAKNYFSAGRQKEALKILWQICSDQDVSFPALLALAFMLTETGQLQEAAPILQRLEGMFQDCLLSDPRLACDFATLEGDYWTFEEDADKAVHWYQICMDLIPEVFPSSWANLRLALLLNNYGDLYEQQESYAEAETMYLKALELMDTVQDDEIYDLPAYQAEILFSLVNVYANIEEYEKAWKWMDQLQALLHTVPPVQKDVFFSRYIYMKGLLELYEDTPVSLEQARADLYTAWQTQNDLQKQGLVKLEHVGKSAYYLASVLPPDPASRPLHTALLNRAMEIFSQVQEKEPAFYLSGLFEIENELGTLLLDENPAEARQYYEQALESCLTYTQKYPQDMLARESWLYIAMNLMEAQYRAQKLPEAMETARLLLHRIQSWQSRFSDLEPASLLLCARISKNSFLPEELRTEASALETILEKKVVQA